MSIFFKRNITDKISGSLKGFFDAGYSSLVTGLKNVLKELHIKINKKQNRELIIVSMFAIIKAVTTVFGNSSTTNHIIGKFQSDIFDEYFKDTQERDEFKELFWKRCDEYSEILNLENQDLALQFGQIFCNNFFGKEEDGGHLDIMILVGSSFLSQMIETTKFLNKASSNNISKHYMEKHNFSVSNALRFGWNTTKNHIGYFLLIMIILFVVTAIFGFFEELVGEGMLSGIISILNWLIQIIIGLAMVKIVLEFLNGNPKPSWDDISKSFSVFWKYLGGTVLTSIIVMVGFVLLIIPGIYFALRFQFVSYLIVDKGLMPIDALKESTEMTKGIKVDLLLLLVAFFAINVLGAILFFVGLLVTVPVTMVALGYVYRKLLGQTPMMPAEATTAIGDAVPIHPGEDLLTSAGEEDLLK